MGFGRRVFLRLVPAGKPGSERLSLLPVRCFAMTSSDIEAHGQERPRRSIWGRGEGKEKRDHRNSTINGPFLPRAPSRSLSLGTTCLPCRASVPAIHQSQKSNTTRSFAVAFRTVTSNGAHIPPPLAGRNVVPGGARRKTVERHMILSELANGCSRAQQDLRVSQTHGNHWRMGAKLCNPTTRRRSV